ncbi:hypothetical protein Caci_1472 [Catenulispora acidiphila DSM 44928]|uniref:Uncharacterized protein n=1 Tax=Catenulispora acidiphila (strain DSM 44928 / JCM 14897 / NBRC 102108 / NRRL B-24433 / ID139908) TaxID=479433 RepID=C7Q9Z7_CATAD|nr:hypothetical protein [Catenulispora acidiphila]ACU70395.1 hypothetical protein Caci_1472 [Catenulispora acidiphila DSM 44928]
MTENPNTPPDPNAGPPPGGPVDRPTTPAQPTPAPTPAPAQPSGSTQPTAEGAQPLGDAPKTGAETASGASTGSAAAAAAPAGASVAEPGSESSMTQDPATGAYTENPWGTAPEEGSELGGPADPNAPNTGVAATFLPGIDAASILALVLAALAAGAYLLVNPLVQAHDAARTWSDFKNNVPRTKQDPFGVQRDWVSYQSWAQIILGLVAVLLALVVLALWTARKNKLRSRAIAQAALVLGLAVVLYGILLKTGAVGSEIPSMKDISTGLSSTQ